MYTDLRDNNQVFTGMFCRFGFDLHIGYSGQTERVAGELVSGTLLPRARRRRRAGRVLLPEDDRAPGGHPVAVLSHAFWMSRFAADPGDRWPPAGHQRARLHRRRRGAAGLRWRRSWAGRRRCSCRS